MPHQLSPLVASYAENQIEAELKQIAIDLFDAHLSADASDINVLGAAHLGSLGLIRKSVNADGLMLLQGDREEDATRYLYRAWKAGGAQLRGLSFLRLYLQMLLPNNCDVYQLWHETRMETVYFGQYNLSFDGSWYFGEERRVPKDYPSRPHRLDDTIGADEYLFLTNRVEITLGISVNPAIIEKIAPTIRAIIPARFLVTFMFWRERYFAEETSLDAWYFSDDAGAFGDAVLVSIDEWLNR